jgi:nicotinamidase-related amidase
MGRERIFANEHLSSQRSDVLAGEELSMRHWEDLVTSEEFEVYRRAGFLRQIQLGQRPALLVIDVQYNFTGEQSEPVPVSVEKYRFSCGENAWNAMPYIINLLGLARQKHIPVVYTQDLESPPDPTKWEAAKGREIVSEVAPVGQDKVITKEGYSSFFATRLLPYLISLNIDTLIVVGGTTSGCVRASVMDAYDYRFKVFVVEECVFDRAKLPHRANLFDIAAKAANVVTAKEMADMLATFKFNPLSGSVADTPSWRVTRT